MDNIVEIWEDEVRAGTWVIAQGFNRNHKHLLEIVNKYKDDFDDFGRLKRRKYTSTGGRPITEYLLNEDKTMFLGTLLRNNDQVVKFKHLLIKKFREYRTQLEKLQKHHKSPAYQLSRDVGKLVRKETTDIIQSFIDYARSQGSKNADKYYVNITKMMNGMLFIVNGKFKNIREVLTIQQLMTVSSAENIIVRAIEFGMSRKHYYKDIYKDVKEKIMLFAKLHGQSEVIVKSLEL